MKRVLIALFVVGFAVVANATVSISTVGQTYSQNFDSLGNDDGTSYTFTDNSTIAGWRVNSEHMDGNSDQYTAEDGSSTSGKAYSFGDDEAADRALGYLGSGGNDYFNMAVGLANDTGETLNKIVISYTGEQWRSGGNTSDNNNSLVFSYRIFDASSGSIPASTSQSGWTTVSGLEFTAPQTSVASGALDGNQSANQTDFSNVEISGLTWSDGQELWVRFAGNDGSGTDAGLAVDDFSVQAVPEPATIAMFGIGGFIAFIIRRSAFK